MEIEHIIEHIAGRYRCSICGRAWDYLPRNNCPGVKVYEWGQWPENLKTKKQLDECGMQTGKLLPAAAGVVFRAKSPGNKMWLYDVNQATPKRVPSTAQLAALAKAHEALQRGWHCLMCGTRMEDYISGGGYCDSCEAVRVADEWLNLPNGIVIFDSETTGLYNADFVQIAAIEYCSGKTRVLFDTLIKPLQEIESGAYGVHGISMEMVANAPEFGEVYEQVYRALSGRNVVIYNAAFDTPVLKSMCKLYHLPRIPYTSMCAMLLYSQYCGEWSYKYQNYRYQSLPGAAHSAIDDCLAALDVLKTMASRLKE